MRIGSFEFSRRELAGSMGDFGTLFPLAALSIGLVLALRNNRHAPAALVLVTLVVAVGAWRGGLLEASHLAPRLPSFTGFALEEVWEGMVRAGFAQLPLTATNAVLATAALIRAYWPERPVPERRLALNMGLMNTATAFFGGMPLCHGSGGLAGQYYFGARTGGTNLIEGTIEIGLGIFLSSTIVGLFSAFPLSIIGAMMLMVGLNLARFAAGIGVCYGVKHYFRATGKCHCTMPLFSLTAGSRM